jgi:hypothetical protein
MNHLIARFKLFIGIKGIRHQQRMYKMCAELNLN